MSKNEFVRASAIAASLALCAAAHAQPAADVAAPLVLANYNGDQIYVSGEYRPVEISTATKTPTPLIDTPQSLSIVTRQQLDDQALIDIGDVLRFTPGASIGQGEGHRDQITIRGQNTTADFFLDGLRDDVQYFRPLYNLERIEILRGANALIFGRGGGGGVINRVTKTPTIGETFAAGAASVDTFGAAFVNGDVNYAVGEAAALRLNAFYENLDNHRDVFGGDRFAVNPTFAATLGANTRALISYEYVQDDRVVDRGVPSLNGEPLEGFDETFFGDPDANLTDLRAQIVRARIDHDFSKNWMANATIQYADYDKFYQNLFPAGFDDVAGTVTLDGYADATDRQNLIAQANLVGDFQTGPIGHTLVFGVEYGDQETENNRRDVVFVDEPAFQDGRADLTTFLFSDPLAIPAFSFPVFNRDRASEVDFLSVYAQDQIDLGPFKIVGGVRYDRFDINVVDQIEVNNGPDDGNDGFLSRVDEKVSPRVGVIYKPQETLSFYASFSRSFLPRSGDQFLTLSLSNEALEPEEFENIEAGLKWDLSSALSFTAAVFRLDRESGTTVDPNDVGSTLIIGSRTRGVEAQLVGEVTDRWRVNAGYSYLDADERGRVVDDALANRTLSQAPEHMFSLWNRYDATDRLGFGLGVTYQSSQFASISNAVELPGFARVDAALYYALSDRLQLQVNVENLLDTDYFPAAHNDNNITTGEPVNARFTISGRL